MKNLNPEELNSKKAERQKELDELMKKLHNGSYKNDREYARDNEYARHLQQEIIDLNNPISKPYKSYGRKHW